VGGVEKRARFIPIFDWRPGYIDLTNTNFVATLVADLGKRRIYKITFKLDPTAKFVVVVNSENPVLPKPDEIVMMQAYKKVEERGDRVSIRPVIQIRGLASRPKRDAIYVKPLIIDKSQRYEVVANEIIYYWIGVEYDVALTARLSGWPYVRYL
jgi:hypothetical protein